MIESYSEIRLTQYSHGGGCGCKISPKVLDQILNSNLTTPGVGKLIVGNNSKDDAAVYDLGNGTALLSTTDFFMPIVDDAFDFGRIASTNAISDIYAMGGRPILAIAILGWPIDKISPEIAKRVLEGSREVCRDAGIFLAGGHSIDSPEPIFGLAVNGLVGIGEVKQNNKAQVNDLIFLTKSIGVGILTTAEKKGVLKKEDEHVATRQMLKLNKVGLALGKLEGVTSMTDVTGFGLAGHLLEMAEGSELTADISFDLVPLLIENFKYYLDNNCIPGGTNRNWESYGDKVSISNTESFEFIKNIIADPQTSGGLLVAVKPDHVNDVVSVFKDFGLERFIQNIGVFKERQEGPLLIS